MTAFDSLPPILRQAVARANFACWDVRLLAAQIREAPHGGPELAKILKTDDEALLRQRQR